MEIERKYLVKSIPENLKDYPCRVMEQGYLNICRRITGEEVPFLNFNLKKGIFRKMTELFRN